jgi:hypothetical protein
MEYDINALERRGPNLALLLQEFEAQYINPGYLPTDGGYLYYAENPQGCVSGPSSAKGYYASNEGISYYPGNEPAIISDRIRSELLTYDLSEAVGAYLRGSFYLCLPSEEIMFEYDSVRDRFQKHTDITFVSAGDDGYLYVLKSDGIYQFEASATSWKAFAFRTAELVIGKDSQFEFVVLDADLGSSGLALEYYLNDTAQPSVTKTTTGRELIYFPVTQEAGNRISVRVSSSAAITESGVGIYGVYLT